MAQRAQISLIDDIDGSEAHDTVNFSLDGVRYEIDLSQEHAEELRGLLADYVEHARRMPGRSWAPRSKPIRRRTTELAGPAADAGGTGENILHSAFPNEAARIRAWAATQGIEVNPLGRIAAAVVEQYRAAQRPDGGSAKEAVPRKRGGVPGTRFRGAAKKDA